MSRHINRASNLLLMLLAVLPQVEIIRDTLDCQTDPSLLLWCSALCLFTWFAASFRRGILIGMPLSALTLYLAYRRFGADPAVELNDLFDKITGLYFERIYAPGSVYDYLSAAQGHTLVLLFLAFLLAAYMSSALTSRSGRIVMSLTGTLPFFAACLSVNGTPSPLPVLATVLFWALLLISGGGYREDSNDGRAVFLCLIPVLLLLSVILWFNRPELYHAEEQDQRLTLRFDELNRRFNLWVSGQSPQPDYVSTEPSPGEEVALGESERSISESSPWRSEQGFMDLTASYDPDELDTRLFTVRPEQSGSLYLRMVSYGDYTGTAWFEAEESAFESLSFTAYSLSDVGESSRLSLRGISDLAYIPAPYYTAETGTDSYLPTDGQDSKTLRYLRFSGDVSALFVPEQHQDEEAEYAEYARLYYTRLPESTRNAMLTIASEAGIDGNDPAVIQQAAQFVQSAGEYDLNTTAYPSDDYAVYFLQEARRGYCIHFATAATALYRALGIPARITEGFLADAQAALDNEVCVANAHAWVEVYLSGVGWLPIEVTGQSGLNRPEPIAAPEPEADSPEETEVTPAPGSENTAQEEPEPGLPVGIIRTPEEETASDHGNAFPWRLLLWIAAAALAVAAIPLWRLLRLSVRKAQIRQEDRRRAAVAIWRWAEKTADYGVAMPRELIGTAEKASFSRHGISEEELERSRELLAELLQSCYAGLTPLQRFRFKYLRAMI